MARLEVVSTAEAPDLAPVVADWLWRAFWKFDGYSYDHVLQLVLHSTVASTMPKTFVLRVDGQAVGTASLAEYDLDSRPDLSPWLAGVFVEPAQRRRGYATPLIEAVASEARRQSHGTLWLYTRTAEGLYAKAGWRTVQRFERHGLPHALMRRDLD